MLLVLVRCCPRNKHHLISNPSGEQWLALIQGDLIRGSTVADATKVRLFGVQGVAAILGNVATFKPIRQLR